MKRLILVWVMILCLIPVGGWAEATGDGAVIEVYCSKDGVEEFMTAFALTHPNGIGWGFHSEEAYCYNVTPISVAEETDIRVFKFSDSAASFAFVDGAVFDLCESFGGYGFLNAVPWDYDQDGQTDLLVASSWGSGISRAEISVFNRAKRTSKVIYSTLYEDEPQVDLIICLDTALSDSTQESQPSVRLYQVRVPLPEDYDFAHLSYQLIGEYHPTQPFALHEMKWDADAATRLLGTWYCEMEEYSMRMGISMTFTVDGMVSLRLIDPISRLYEDGGTAQYRVDGENLTLITNGESVTTPLTFSDEGLVFPIYGMEGMTFRKLSAEELMQMESLQPKYQSGDTTQAVINYGKSEHFTHEQMDAAIAVIKDRFLTWLGCEMRSIAYVSDERSAREYQYYAGSESRKTGKNYVDGIVFTSSFHTPPEGQGDPYSGLQADHEYTGWEWILLLSESGEWELVTWGY